MPVLKEKITCCTCSELVEKSRSRLLNPLEREKKFECYNCFRSAKELGTLELSSKPKEKRELFCGLCKYSFRSSRAVCPYCGKKDYLEEKNVRVIDLLS